MVKTLIWTTEEGLPIRLTHMSDEHLVNAISWLLVDPSTGEASDMKELHHGVTLCDWVKELTHELYRRLHPEVVNG